MFCDYIIVDTLAAAWYVAGLSNWIGYGDLTMTTEVTLIRYEVTGKTGLGTLNVHLAVHSVWTHAEAADAFLQALREKYPEESYEAHRVTAFEKKDLEDKLGTLV